MVSLHLCSDGLHTNISHRSVIYMGAARFQKKKAQKGPLCPISNRIRGMNDNSFRFFLVTLCKFRKDDDKHLKKGGRLREPKIYLKNLNRPVDIFQISCSSSSSSSSCWSQLLSLTLSLCLYHSLRGTVSSVAAIGKRLQRDRRVKEIAGVMETDLSHPKKEFTVHHKKRKRRRRQRDLYLLQSNFLFDSAQYHNAITS